MAERALIAVDVASAALNSIMLVNVHLSGFVVDNNNKFMNNKYNIDRYKNLLSSFNIETRLVKYIRKY